MSFEKIIRQIVREENEKYFQQIKSLIQPQWNYPDVLTPEEAREILRLGRDKMYEWCRQPGTPAIRIGSEYKIPTIALFKWLDEQSESQKQVKRVI